VVPNVTENPEGRRKERKARLHGIRYDKSCFDALPAEINFGVDRFDYETDGQSGLSIFPRQTATA
jgi:hypothetical protein